MLAKKMKHAVLQCMMFLGLIAFLYGCGGGGSSGGSASTNNPVTTTSTTTTATQSPKETSKQHVEKTFESLKSFSLSTSGSGLSLAKQKIKEKVMRKEATSSSSLYCYDTYSVGYDSMFIAYKEGSGTQQDPMAIYFYNGSKATGEYKTNSDSTCTLTIDPNSWRAKETIWECAVEARSCYADYVFNADTSGCAETELIFIADNGKKETMNFRMVMALGNLYSDTDDKIGMDGTGINSEGTQDFCYALRTDKNQGIYTETVRDTQGNVTASGSFTVKQTGTYETTTSGRITYSGGSYEEWTDVYTKNNPTTSKNEEKETLTVKYSDGYTLSLTFDSSRNVTGTVKNSSGATVAAISGKPDALSYGTELTVTYADGTKEVMVI